MENPLEAWTMLTPNTISVSLPTLPRYVFWGNLNVTNINDTILIETKCESSLCDVQTEQYSRKTTL